MLVREAMSSPIVTVPRGASARQAIRVLYEHNITAAPVVDESGRMVGIVSEMDLLRGEFEADPRAFIRPVTPPADLPPRGVEEVMTTEVRTARETSDVAELADMMIRTGVKSIPVLRDEEIVGMVSRRDLMAVLAHSDKRIRDDVLAAIEECCPEGSRWTVAVHDGVVELHGDADEQARQLADVVVRTVPGATRVVLAGAPSTTSAAGPGS